MSQDTLSISPYHVQGSIHAPASKSAFQRALMLASRADGRSLLLHASLNDDVSAVIDVVRAVGAKVHFGPTVMVQPSNMVGQDSLTLNLGESGFAMRSWSTFGLTFADDIHLQTRGTLRHRPIAPVLSWLRALGLHTSDGSAWPLHIHGKLMSGRYTVDASWTSQLLSGLLMALPTCEGNSFVHAPSLVSGRYIDLTLGIMRDFGVKIQREGTTFHIPGNQTYQGTVYPVEGDWSGAANFMVAAALSGQVNIHGLKRDSVQADRHMLHILEMAGAAIEWDPSQMLTVRRECTLPFHVDLTQCPDLFPPAVVLALGCEGRTTLQGAHRLIYKESNRAQALLELGKALGGHISLEDDTLIIDGTGRLQGGQVDSHHDHRIAMAAATAACICATSVDIIGAGSVSKSYPAFFRDLRRVQQ